MLLAKSLLEQYEGLIFDMDGTLIDTMPSHALAWEKVGQVLGYPIKGDVMYEFGGAPTKTIAQQTMLRYGVPMELLDQVVKMKREFGMELVFQQATLLPAMEIVKVYFGKKPMALGTGSYRTMVEALLNKFALQPYFNGIVAAEDVTKHKPDPETFLRCAQLINVRAENCLVFEDADLGIQAALNGGMDVFDVRVNRLIKCTD